MVTAVAAPASASYSRHPASHFDSLDSLEMDRLHTQLRSAYSWLDISASVDEFRQYPMVDEESIVAALSRLGTIYQHLGESEQAEIRSSGLIERLAAMSERRLKALSPTQLTHTLEALARLDFEAPDKFLEAARKQARSQVQDIPPSQLPLLLCAFAALGCDPGSTIVTALGDALSQRQVDIAPAEVSATLMALATIHTKPAKQVVKGLATLLRRQIDSFRPADLADALRALAKLRFYPGDDVMRRIAARANGKLRDFQPTGRQAIGTVRAES